MNEPPAQARIEFEPHADPALEPGVYANGLAIWHTAHEFTFDFFVSSQPPQETRGQSGETIIRAPHRLVARLRIPPTAVFDIIRTINENLTMYERKFGQIRPPGTDSPLYPPDDPGGGGPGPRGGGPGHGGGQPGPGGGQPGPSGGGSGPGSGQPGPGGGQPGAGGGQPGPGR